MPTILTSYAVEKCTFAVGCALADENGDAVTPDSITWSLVDDNGNVINSLEDQGVATPTASSTIVLSGDDLQLRDQNKDYEMRYLEVAAMIDSDLGDDLPVKERCEFKVINLNKSPLICLN